VNEGYIIIAADAVSESREFLFDSDHLDRFGERVSDVSEFIVSGVVGYEETLLISCGGSADNAGASNGGLNDRDK